MEPQKSTPRDLFMYLLSALALYVSAVAAITLLFQYINASFTDPANPNYGLSDTVRWFTALLVIIFPVYLWTARTLAKERDREPGRSELKVRKWLLYLTLFLAAGLIIGDLVAVVYNFLNGELSVRFYLKVLAILFVAGAIFGYYLYDLKRAPGEAHERRAKWLILGALAVMAAIVIAGFWVAGSPFKQRQVRLDQQRISDLQAITYQVEQYWAAKRVLPASLESLSALGGGLQLKDRETGEPYIYRTVGELEYELCADFSLSSAAAERYEYAPERFPDSAESWAHEAGRDCFTRTIDPDILG